MNKKNILITGATGLIGTALTQKLSDKGYTPIILTTTAVNDRRNTYKWNPELKVCDRLPNKEFYGVINLAGASIADNRWNKEGKELISKSRINSTNYLKSIVNNLHPAPKHIISVSAIGYYGLIDNEIKTEDSAAGADFAAKVCADWEQAASNLKTNNNHLSILRIGIVLAKKGGFYKKIKDLAKLKIAVPVGSGLQPVSWIHVDDLVNIFVDILDNKLKPGIYNAVANIENNKNITKIIAKKNGQPFIWPAVPAFLLKIIFGDKFEIFCKGTRVSNSKLLEEGFQFEYTDLDKAILDLSKT